MFHFKDISAVKPVMESDAARQNHPSACAGLPDPNAADETTAPHEMRCHLETPLSDADREYFERFSSRQVSIVDKVIIAAGAAVMTCGYFVG